MSDVITPDLVDLNLASTDKDSVVRSLAERLQAAGRLTDLEGFLADVRAREAQMPTGLEGGIGIPHCRSVHVTEPTLGFGRSARLVEDLHAAARESHALRGAGRGCLPRRGAEQPSELRAS